MDIDAKLRPLFLLQILKERTDEDNYLTTTQLCDILKREYGLDTHRTTLKSDIKSECKQSIEVFSRFLTGRPETH